MPLTTNGRNDLLTNGLTNFTHVSAYDDLGTTEHASVTRQAVTWTASSSGVRDNNAQLSVPMPSSATPVVVGSIHSALSAGNLQAWFQIGSTLRGTAEAAATGDTLTDQGHGLATDDRVFFAALAGQSLPTGISATTLYFVLASGLTANVFKVSTTSGGAALDITADGEVAWFKTVPQTFPTGGNLVFSTGALDVDGTYV